MTAATDRLAEIEEGALGRIAAWEAPGFDYPSPHDLMDSVYDVAVMAKALRAALSQREAFLSSPSLDPAWIAGWHSANDHILAAITAALSAGEEGK